MRQLVPPFQTLGKGTSRITAGRNGMPHRNPFARIALALAFGLALSPCVQARGDALPLLREEDETRVLPVWNNASGRFEALLLIEPAGASGHTHSRPLDNMLGANQLPAIGSGLRMELANGSDITTSLRLDPNAGLALLCNGATDFVAAPWVFGDQCLLAALNTTSANGASPLPRSATPAVDFGLQWESANGGLNLDFGLSWLDVEGGDAVQATLADLPLWGGPLASSSLLNAQALNGSRLQSRQLLLGSQFDLGAGRWFALDGGVGTQRWSGIGAASIEPLRWDSAQITLGLGIGGFSSQVRARLIELPHSGERVSGLDLGFSWRTPWHGVFSFGARNVLNDGTKTEHWPLTELPALEAPGGRTPYVQYRQEL